MGDILTIQKGKKHSIAHDITTSSTRLLQIEDLRNDNQIKYTNDTYGVLATEEDLMIVWDGANAGTIGYGKRGFIGSTISLLKKKDQNSFDTRFLGKFLQSQFSKLRKKTSGSTIPHIDRSILENISIPVLNSLDQIHIANVLSQAEALIAQRKESIRLLDELVKSKFQEMFGDPNSFQKREPDILGNHIEFLTSGSRGWAKYYSITGSKFLRIQNVGNGLLKTEDIIKVKAPNSAEADRTRVKEGDFLLSITADLGRTGVIPKNFGDAYINQHLALIRLKRSLNSMYASFFYSMPLGNNEIQKKNKNGVKAGLNFSDINSLLIFVPPIGIQIHFSEFVENVQLQKVQYQRSLQDLEILYSSISQKAFNGELMINQKSSLRNLSYQVTPEISSDAIPADSLKEQTTSKENDKTKTVLSSKKEEQSFLKRKILGSYIINHSLDDSQFGDVKFEKLLHLSEYLILKRNFGQHYIQKVAGPYDNKFTIPFFQQIEKDRWFRRLKKERQFHFQQGDKHESSTKTYNYFSEEELGAVQSLIQLFKKAKYEKVEIVSTLYAVWNNRIIKGEPIEDKLLKEDFLNWDPQKTKFEDRLDKALAWMREKNLVPDGWGALIEKTK
nr:restriction endonuclease subunit S [Leptospira kmetyi]